MKHCCPKLEPLPVGECQPCPTGLRSTMELPVYPGSPKELLEIMNLTGLTMDSLFLVPDGDVYQVKTARQIIEKEKGPAKDLAKSLLKRK